MILNEVMKDTADAIREKTGKSELIKPVDFAEEIKGITAGGSGESGGSNVEYLDLSGEGIIESAVSAFAWLAKAYLEGMTVIAPLQVLIDEGVIGVGKYPSAVMIDLSAKLSLGDGFISIKELIVAQGHGIVTEADIDAIPRLTKEQFYDLNA